MMVLSRCAAASSLLGQPRAPVLSRSRPSVASLSHGAVLAQREPVVLTTSLPQSSSALLALTVVVLLQGVLSAASLLWCRHRWLLGVVDQAEKLPPPAVEPRAKSCACFLALSGRVAECGCCTHTLAQAGVQALNLACCCVCLRAGAVLGVRPG